MVVSPLSVLLLVSVTALVNGAEEKVISVDRYGQDLEYHESMQLVDLLRGRKPKCKTLGACKDAGGKCTNKKDCDGKVKKIKNGCSRGCVCCIRDGSGGDMKMFKCDNGREVPERRSCNGYDDCGDGSDERSCSSCVAGEMLCPNGQCIREAWKCDGYEDCKDGSDEANCGLLPYTGVSHSVARQSCSGFKCRNGRCIISSWKCDGWNDCGDNSDEDRCNECSSSQFKCKSDGKCIWGNWKCDNYKDCSDNSDEADCKKCDPSTQFECKNKNCISSWKKCNGKNDCGDGSDEENCPKACQCGVANTQRILGGMEVSPKRKYPWQIGLVSPGYYINCGGTIINDRWILTAAHCIVDKNTCRLKYESSSPLKVWVGEHNQLDNSDDVSNTKKYSIKTYVKHPSYNCKTLDYDFALLELKEAIPFNNVIRPICLPKDDSKTYAGKTGIVTGWGSIDNAGTMSKYLREVQVPIFANNNCGRWGKKPAMKMCAGGKGGKDSCGGDSGGPMYVVEKNRYVQVGVVSYGSSAGCASSSFPGIYARVSKILSWITTTTASGKTCD